MSPRIGPKWLGVPGAFFLLLFHSFRSIVAFSDSVLGRPDGSFSPKTVTKGDRPRSFERISPLAPPFPNGPCGGTVVTIPSKDTFGTGPLNANRILLPPRDILVWLPPEYDHTPDDTRFPVLYCHDGQNAMQDESSWTGASWRLTGALTRLSERQLLEGPPPIVVLLPSAKGDFIPGVRRRYLEYGGTNQIFAQAHADFVAQTLKPLVDASFRTLSGPSDTLTIGSSMGGQASMHLLLRHSDLFGGAACLSPFFGPDTLASVLATTKSRVLSSKRVYLDIGGDVGDKKVPFLDVLDHLTPVHQWNPGYFWLDTSLQPSVDAMRLSLRLAGVEVKYHTVPGGRHNERAWAHRIHLPLLHLYGKHQ